MKLKARSTKGLFLICMFALAIGCVKNERDKEDPKVDFLAINGVSSSPIIEPATIALFEGRFSDDVGLVQYKIDIEDSLGNTAGNVYSFQLIGDVEGESAIVMDSIPIDTNAVAGIYNLIVTLLDQKGNTTESEKLVLELQRPVQPQLQLTAPDFSVVFSKDAGDTIPIIGTVTDNSNIAQIEITLGEEGSLYSTSYTYNDSIFTQWDAVNLVTDNNQVIIPTSAEAGDHPLEIRIKDSSGNITRLITTVVVRN